MSEQAVKALVAAARWLLDDITDAGENKAKDAAEEFDSVAALRAALAPLETEPEPVSGEPPLATKTVTVTVRRQTIGYEWATFDVVVPLAAHDGKIAKAAAEAIAADDDLDEPQLGWDESGAGYGGVQAEYVEEIDGRKVNIVLPPVDI